MQRAISIIIGTSKDVLDGSLNNLRFLPFIIGNNPKLNSIEDLSAIL